MSMSSIRPDLPVVLPQPSAPARSAQAAFFRAAMDQVNGVQIQTTPAQTAPRAQTAAPSETGRSLRPGSLLDIKV